MGLLGFQIRPVAVLEIVDFGGVETALNRSEIHSKWWGASRPTTFNGFRTRLGPVGPPKIDDLQSRNRPDLKTQQCHVRNPGPFKRTPGSF